MSKRKYLNAISLGVMAFGTLALGVALVLPGSLSANAEENTPKQALDEFAKQASVYNDYAKYKQAADKSQTAFDQADAAAKQAAQKLKSAGATFQQSADAYNNARDQVEKLRAPGSATYKAADELEKFDQEKGYTKNRIEEAFLNSLIKAADKPKPAADKESQLVALADVMDGIDTKVLTKEQKGALKNYSEYFRGNKVDKDKKPSKVLDDIDTAIKHAAGAERRAEGEGMSSDSKTSGWGYSQPVLSVCGKTRYADDAAAYVTYKSFGSKENVHVDRVNQDFAMFMQKVEERFHAVLDGKLDKAALTAQRDQAKQAYEKVATEFAKKEKAAQDACTAAKATFEAPAQAVATMRSNFQALQTAATEAKTANEAVTPLQQKMLADANALKPYAEKWDQLKEQIAKFAEGKGLTKVAADIRADKTLTLDQLVAKVRDALNKPTPSDDGDDHLLDYPQLPDNNDYDLSDYMGLGKYEGTNKENGSEKNAPNKPVEKGDKTIEVTPESNNKQSNADKGTVKTADQKGQAQGKQHVKKGHHKFGAPNTGYEF